MDEKRRMTNREIEEDWREYLQEKAATMALVEYLERSAMRRLHRMREW